MNCVHGDDCIVKEARGAQNACERTCAYAPSYQAWRISYQSSEQAALSAWEESNRLRAANKVLAEALEDCSERLFEAMGGQDDPENEARATEICKRYQLALQSGSKP